MNCTFTSSARNFSPLLLLLVSLFLPGETWYIRGDGGTRYSSGAPKGQCNGKSDTAYRGKGVNQPCAFKDFRYLYSDGTYNNKKWVIQGGDTVVLRSGPWRVGYNGPNPKDYFGSDAGSPQAATNPSIPAGTPEHHTRIVGEHYQNCTTKTQIFGGYSVGAVINLSDTQFVDIECVELTDHAQCGRIGVGNQCKSSYPLDDFAFNGVVTNTKTANIRLIDVDIHGFASRGIIGPIGGNIYTERLRIGFNTGAGWDFDDGKGTPSTGGTVTLKHAVIEWNGCTEEYPIIHPIPAFTCWDQNSGGYGDAIGTANGDAASFLIQDSVIRYNTQDGPDLLHSSKGSFVIDRSQIYGNMGQQIKLGATSNSTVTNSIIIHNCNRISAPMDGAPANYNAHLSNFCRAGGDGIAMSWGGNGTMMRFDNNTFLGYGATSFSVQCYDPAGCSNGTKTLRNNVFVGYGTTGYDNNRTPGMFCYSDCNGSPFSTSERMWTERSNNVFYNMRSCPVGLLTRRFADENCRDPKLTSVPAAGSPLSSEDLLDLQRLDLHPASNGPLVGAGVAIQRITIDQAGTARPAKPSIGALEPKR